MGSTVLLVQEFLLYTCHRTLVDRAEPIVLKVLMIMLCCTAQKMCQLCS